MKGNIRKLAVLGIISIIVPFILAACATTPMVAKAQKLATSAEEIVGTWLAGFVGTQGGYNYIRFDKDGTFRLATALDDLNSRPYSINSYQFNGTKMVIKAVSGLAVSTCGQVTGTYEIQLLESGNIRLVAINDQCGMRVTNISGEYKPVR